MEHDTRGQGRFLFRDGFAYDVPSIATMFTPTAWQVLPSRRRLPSMAFNGCARSFRANKWWIMTLKGKDDSGLKKSVQEALEPTSDGNNDT
jgi:hypothetical protein